LNLLDIIYEPEEGYNNDIKSSSIAKLYDLEGRSLKFAELVTLCFMD